MASDVGSQVVTMRFHRPVDTDIVNKRFLDIRKSGIYKGGYLTKTGGDDVSLSALVCEITDGTHQVRVETTVAVSKTLTEASPYLVLNWAYTGVDGTDYMVIEISGSPDTNDLVIGKGVFVASALSTIDYSERSTPDTLSLFLRVEATETPSTSVRVRAGVGHGGSIHSAIIDQVVDLSGYSLNNVVYIYINDSGGIAHSATVATYAGKALLAKIVYPAGVIANSIITDVRSFVASPAIPDESSINRSSAGKLQVKALGITNAKIHSNVVDGVTIEKDGSTGKLQIKSGVLLSTYDSGWFAISVNTTYTKAHGLSAIPLIVQCWYSESDDGSGDVIPCNSGFEDDYRGLRVVDIDATNIKIRGSGVLTRYSDAGGINRNRFSGYARIVAIK